MPLYPQFYGIFTRYLMKALDGLQENGYNRTYRRYAMKKKFRRIGAIACAAVLSFGALAMFAGCTTDHPEIEIIYTFNGKDYKVDYRLSRADAPKTVQHFIELADAGFYNGLCVHDYDSNFLYTGGYRLVDEDGDAYDYDANNTGKSFELEEIDYLTAVKELEKNGNDFTQSVWYTLPDGTRDPLYTVYGEFSDNGVYSEALKDYYHSEGALVMYYTEKGSKTPDVTVLRADGGKGNDVNGNGKIDEAEKYQTAQYATNSITSLFYTFLGESSPTNTAKYCVIGGAIDYQSQLSDGLLKAIADYKDTLAEDVSFTAEQTVKFNTYDYFEDIRKSDINNEETPFNTPMSMPIIVKSVKVTKY